MELGCLVVPIPMAYGTSRLSEVAKGLVWSRYGEDKQGVVRIKKSRTTRGSGDALLRNPEVKDEVRGAGLESGRRLMSADGVWVVSI